jgi:hypothetical protein
METTVTLTIPQRLYRRAQKLASKRQMQVEDVLATVLNATEDSMESLVPEEDEEMEREMAAYIAMHPRLLKTHLGQHVAVYHGELIDHDTDYGALYERIVEKYLDEFVLLTTVKAEPIETIVVRSPRLVREDE